MKPRPMFLGRGMAVAAGLLVCAAEIPAGAQITEDTVLYSETLGNSEQFGDLLVSDGRRAIAVARAERPPGAPVGGRLYFLEFEDGQWVVDSAFTEQAHPQQVTFASSAHMSGDWAVAQGFGNGPGLSFLHVFQHTGTTWESRGTIDLGGYTINNGVTLVAIEDDVLIVRGSGEILSFVLENGAWRRIGNLGPSPALLTCPTYSPATHIYLKEGLAYLRLFAIPISFPQICPYGFFVFERVGDDWVWIETVGHPPNTLGVGSFIDVDGDWLMYSNVGTGIIGQLHIYHRDHVANQWIYHSSVSSPNPVTSGTVNTDGFGLVFDLVGERVLIGAHLQANALRRSRGRAYLFEYDAAVDQWLLERTFASTQSLQLPATEVSHFGYSVALLDGGALIGDNLAFGPNGERTGAVYVFEDDFGTPSCTGTFSPLEARLDVGGMNHLQNGGIRLEGSDLPPSVPYFTLASTSPAFVPLPGGSGEHLCVGAPRINAGPPAISAPDGTTLNTLDGDEAPLWALAPGDTMVFQLLFRTAAGASQPIGVTNAISVTFH